MSRQQTRWVSVKEAADGASVHPETVRRWARQGRVRAQLVGGSLWRVAVDDDGVPVPP